MKNSKILKYLRRALSDGGAKKKAALKKVIEKIKKKERRLKLKLDVAESETDKEAILAKLKVNRAHRKKGVQALRKLSGKA